MNHVWTLPCSGLRVLATITNLRFAAKVATPAASTAAAAAAPAASAAAGGAAAKNGVKRSAAPAAAAAEEKRERPVKKEAVSIVFFCTRNVGYISKIETVTR